MTPYKINSLVKRRDDKTILMIVDRRIVRDHNKGHYIKYTVIEPHRPHLQRYANHDGLIKLEAS